MGTSFRNPDTFESGHGQAVLLLHSSVAGAAQWRKLMAEEATGFHFIAVNMFGYGASPTWKGPEKQTLEDQALLAAAALPKNKPVMIVGHSFGGSVAMKLAALLGSRVSRLVLIEANPFSLLQQNNRADAYSEAIWLRNCIKENGAAGDWAKAASVFADYWNGPGAWDHMPEDRREKFIDALKPNFHEWDAALSETTLLHEWAAALPPKTTVLEGEKTTRSIREIGQLFRQGMPHWRFVEMQGLGHMAPLTHPAAVNPLILEALRG